MLRSRFTFLVEVLSESLKRSLACPPPTGVSGTLGAAESVTGAITGAATGVGTDTGEIGGVSSETLQIVYKYSRFIKIALKYRCIAYKLSYKLIYKQSFSFLAERQLKQKYHHSSLRLV